MSTISSNESKEDIVKQVEDEPTFRGTLSRLCCDNKSNFFVCQVNLVLVCIAILTGNYGTAPIAVPRLASSPMELAHMLYEALSIRDEFAKILRLIIKINLWFNIYVPDGNTCTRLCSVLRVPPGIRPRFEFEIRPLQYGRTVLRYWRDAGWVRGTTSQLRLLRLIARTTLSVFHINLYSQPTFGSRLLTRTPEECCVGSIPYRAPIAFVAIRGACRYVARADPPMAR